MTTFSAHAFKRFIMMVVCFSPLWLAFLAFPADWLGWYLLFFSFALVLLHPSIRNDGTLLCSVWLCILLHGVVSIVNAYLVQIPGSEADAVMLHFRASEIANRHIFAKTEGLAHFKNLVASMYSATGISLLAGQQVSVFAFVMAAMLFVTLMDMLEIKRFRAGVFALFGALPSRFLYDSFLLRDSWETLFFLLFGVSALLMLKRPGLWPFFVNAVILTAISYWPWSIGILCCLMVCEWMFLRQFYLGALGGLWLVRAGTASLMTGSNYLWGILVPTVVCWPFIYRSLIPRGNFLRVTVWVLLLTIGVLATADLLLPGAGQILVRSANLANGFRQTSESVVSRATYIVDFNSHSLLAFALSLVEMVAHYLFEPFLWKVAGFKDFVGGLEALLRMFLLFFACKSTLMSQGLERQRETFLLVCYFLMATFWSVGTTNYGTAFRHNVTHTWIIVLLGGPPLLELLASGMRSILERIGQTFARRTQAI